jgi:hypothetical protein
MGHYFKIILVIVLALNLAANLFAKDKNAAEFYQAEKEFTAYNFAQAESGYRNSLAAYQNVTPMASYIENQIAKCLRYQKKTEAAAEQYRRVKKNYTGTTYADEAQEAIARTYYEARDYEKAGPEFEKVGDEVVAKEKQNNVKADAEGKKVQTSEKAEMKNQVFSYAAYNYYKSGKFKEANNAKRKIKNEIP